MPSPFPGMDPFIEGQIWKTFHSRFLNVLADELVVRLRPRYVVDVEDFVYLMHDETDESVQVREPDLTIAPGDQDAHLDQGSAKGTAVVATPIVLTLPKPRRVRQHHLVLRRADDREVVTVIELLSPWNKRGLGRTQYLGKREGILEAVSNLVEVDLLRGGKRLPTKEKLPVADYFVFVCRPSGLPKVDVFAWGLRQPLPAIPIPLSAGERDCEIDLQRVFAILYDRAGYDYSLNYGKDVTPPLPDAERDWVRSILHPAGSGPRDK